MEMQTSQIIGLICLIVGFVVIIGIPIYRELKGLGDAVIGKRNTDIIFSIYDQIWSGDPADRVTAWFRTIQYLQRNGFPEEIITEARLHKIFEERKGQKSSYSVNANGRLIDIDERGQNPEVV